MAVLAAIDTLLGACIPGIESMVAGPGMRWIQAANAHVVVAASSGMAKTIACNIVMRT